MSTTKMHTDEIDITVELVRELLREQFPEWADLPPSIIAPAGTDNVMFKLDDSLAVRIPRTERAVQNIEKECQWLSQLSSHSPLPVPAPIAQGKPNTNYVLPWAICKLLPGDLHPGNLLVKDDYISAVIDFGSCGVGDPAADLMVAWTVLDAKNRETFRSIVEPDDATWARGRGWAFTMGVVAYPYYLESSPVFATVAKRAMNEALADF